MKIDAKVKFNDEMAEKLECETVRVPVDLDYVSVDESEIKEWVRNELEEMFGCSFPDETFEIKNMDEIVEELCTDGCDCETY